MKLEKRMFFFMILILTVSLWADSASTQEDPSGKSASITQMDRYLFELDAIKNPFKPADTSSPRDTLRSLLTDLNFMIDEWKRHKTILNRPEGYLAYERALSTLDFSTTPETSSRSIMSHRLLMLYEILARIELPPDSEIPGDNEVAQGSLDHWPLPGTPITIQRIEKGPRAGEFLFSAFSVQRLDRYYRMVKHLPYKPDFTPGVYEAIFRSKSSITYLEGSVRNRLEPIDTSSPRSTLEGFLYSVNSVYALVMKTDAALKANPPTIKKDDAHEIEAAALNLMARARATIDLSRVPEAIRDQVGVVSVLQLKEIFDRMPLPPIESVPDMEMVKAERQRIESTSLDKVRPVRWRYPNTSIEIVEVMEGEQEGSFLFSARTVRRLGEYYEKVRDIPYRKDYPQLSFEYLSPETSKGFYNYYFSTPGHIIRQASLVGRIVESLPGWFKTMHGGQTVWQWVSLILFFSLAILLLVMFHGVLLRRPVGLSSQNRHWRQVVFNLVAIGMLYSIFWILDDTINLSGHILVVVRTCSTLVEWYFWATGALFLCNAIAETVVASPKIDPQDIQASYIRALFGIFGLITMLALMITGLYRVGVSLGPLLAGAGIGGLAIALAARSTLENVIGSFVIFIDKPYQVGQRVKVMGQDGTVESIGLRSTKIRLLSGHLTSIPNEKMAAVEVENIGQRPYIRRLFNVTITYDTLPEKIIRAEEILREILAVPQATGPKNTAPPGKLMDTAAGDGQRAWQPHPNEAINRPGFPPRVYFNELNADSLNILVIYWYHPADYWKYLEHCRWVNIQIIERFNADGINFAFPTQTLHMAGDEKRPLSINQRWVSEDEAFSPSRVLAQAAALGAQAVQTSRTPASDSVRPQLEERDPSRPKTEGELTEAPLEDDVLHADAKGPAGEAGGDGTSDRS